MFALDLSSAVPPNFACVSTTSGIALGGGGEVFGFFSPWAWPVLEACEKVLCNSATPALRRSMAVARVAARSVQDPSILDSIPWILEWTPAKSDLGSSSGAPDAWVVSSLWHIAASVCMF